MSRFFGIIHSGLRTCLLENSILKFSPFHIIDLRDTQRGVFRGNGGREQLLLPPPPTFKTLHHIILFIFLFRTNVDCDGKDDKETEPEVELPEVNLLYNYN